MQLYSNTLNSDYIILFFDYIILSVYLFILPFEWWFMYFLLLIIVIFSLGQLCEIMFYNDQHFKIILTSK